ncbi:hypothetical protein K8I61_04340 [bacterium]|nr:hypothetical protein [bacterium]
MTLVKKIGLGVGIVVFCALVVGAVYIYPWIKMPPEDPAILEAKLAEYRARADELANRPPEDRDALYAILDELQPIADEHSSEIASLLKLDSCPPYDADNLAAAAEMTAPILVLDDRLRTIAEGGVILRQEYRHDVDIPDFLPVRFLFYTYSADAVRSALEGNTAATVDRMLTVAPLIDGLANTPILINAMMSVAGYQIYDLAVIAMLPVLSDEGLERVRASIESRPSVAKAVIESMPREIALTIETLDHTEDGTLEKLFEILRADGFRETMFQKIVRKSLSAGGYFRRERLVYLSMATKILDGYRAWLAAGATDPPHLFDDNFVEDFWPSLALIAWPNTDGLVGKGREADMRAKAVLGAIDDERKRRVLPSVEPVELPYDDERKIVITKDYGCIVRAE